MNLVVQIIIKNILKIDSFQLVSPRMQNLETFVRHVLLAIPLDIFLDEFKIGLVSLDGVTQVVFLDGFFNIPHIGAQNADARSGLQILPGVDFLKLLFNGLSDN